MIFSVIGFSFVLEVYGLGGKICWFRFLRSRFLDGDVYVGGWWGEFLGIILVIGEGSRIG